MANSIGDVTYGRNRYCAIVARKRPVPTVPPTPLQDEVRARFSAAVLYWQTMDAKMRTAWARYALNTPRENGLGDMTQLTAQTTYVGIRMAALEWNPLLPDSTWDYPPEIPGNLDIPRGTDLSTPGSTTVQVRIYNPSITTPMVVVAWLSYPLPHTVNFHKAPYDLTKLITTDVIDPESHYNIFWKNLTTDRRYHWRLRGIEADIYNRISRYFHCHSDL